MKFSSSSIFLFIVAAMLTLLQPMAAFAVSSHASSGTLRTADNGTYSYVHFPGVGRYVLALDGGTPVAQHIDAGASTPEATKWQLVASGSAHVLQNEAGQYLTVSTASVRQTFGITTDAAAATAFTVSANNYYPERNATATTRYCLVLASAPTKALGVKDGALALVNAHSRYSVVRMAGNVLGVDFPLLTTERSSTTYNMGIYYGTQLDPYYVSKGKTKYGTVVAHIPGKQAEVTKDMLETDVYRWYVTEANDDGDVYVQTKTDDYLNQAAALSSFNFSSTPTATTLMRLYENVDGGAVVAYNDGTHKVETTTHDWKDFWQIKAVNTGTFAFAGWENQVGGTGGGMEGKAPYGNFRQVDFPFNRLQFINPVTQKYEEESVTSYIQFSGCGRTLLGEDGKGGVTAQVVGASDTKPTDKGLTWEVTDNGQTATLKSGNGRYLCYDAATSTFSTTTDADAATRFGYARNTYYADVSERIQFLLPDHTDQAIGVRGGQLTVVKANSRYAVICKVKEVHGADLPTYSTQQQSHYYYMPTFWGNDVPVKDYLCADGATIKETNTNSAKLDNTKNAWRVIEVNELGDIVLQARNGYYLKQANKGSAYSGTLKRSEAAVFELVEGTDLGAVKWKNASFGPMWYDFWQLRNKSILGESWYLFEGTEHRYGDSGNKLQKDDGTNFGKYSYAANRVLFQDMNLTEPVQQYVQFSGNGRTILTEDGLGGAAATLVAADNPNPDGKGQRWTVNVSADGTTATLKSGNGRYLCYDAATQSFSTSTTEAGATRFGWTENTYYSDVADRHQLLLPGQTQQAVGVRNGQLQVVKAHSRYAVIVLATSVEGADVPDVSTAERMVYYYIQPAWGGNAADMDRLYADPTKTAKLGASATKKDDGTNLNLDYKSDPYRWMLEEVNDLGDVRLRTRGGIYLMQADADSHYSITESQADAAVFQLVEAVDQGPVWWKEQNATTYPNGAYISGQYWPTFWQLKNTANGYFFFEGNKGGFGGLQNDTKNYPYGQVDNYAQYLFAFNRVRFERSELDPETSIETYQYVQFPGTGRSVLCAAATGVGIEAVAEDNETPASADKMYKWSLQRSGSNYRLHTEDDLYLAYDADKGFYLTADKAEAHLFQRTQSTYYHETGLVRYNLESATLAGQALGVVDSTLQWAPTNTRFTACLQADAVKGQSFPEISSEYDHWWYQVQMWYGNEGDDKTNYLYTKSNKPRLTVNGVKPADNSAVHLWSFEQANEQGDVLVKNKAGLYIYQPASGKAFDYTDDRAKATVMRLMEYVDGGQVTFSDDGTTYVNAPANHTWDRFWQLKAVDNDSYLYVDWNNYLGGEGGMKNRPLQNQFSFANNRSRFVLKAHEMIDLNSLHGYLQFPGIGRTVLVQEAEGGAVKACFVEDGSTPEGDGCQWTLQQLEGTRFVLKNAAAQYLTVDATKANPAFATTADEQQATVFILSLNSYYNAEGLVRFNLTLESDATKALAADNDEEGVHLTLAAPDTRYSVVRWADKVFGPQMPVMSDCGTKVYNLPFEYYMLKADGSIDHTVNYMRYVPEENYPAHATTSTLDARRISSIWRVKRANALGDIQLMTIDGHYLAQANNSTVGYPLTAEAAKAATFRPVEHREGEDGDKAEFWNDYWQLRDVQTGKFLFVGWNNTFGGQGNGVGKDPNGVSKGDYDFTNNRMKFVETQLPEGYFLFSAFGPYPLSDNGGAKLTIHASHEQIDDRGAVWSVRSTKGSDYLNLRSGNGTYVAYDEAADAFVCTTDSTKAYPFTLRRSQYEHNNAERYEFCSTDGTKAMRLSNHGADGIITWTEEHDTRFTTMHLFSMIAGPTLPDANAKGTKLKLYHIFSANGISTPNGQTTQKDANDPDKTVTINVWRSDYYYLNDPYDYRSSTNDGSLSLIYVPDMDYTSHLTDTDNQKFSGSYWAVERVADDWTWNGVTHRGGIGDYYLRSFRENRYLKYDTTLQRFVSTDSKAEAAVVRLIEDDNDYMSWQLQMVNAPDQKNDIISFGFTRDETTNTLKERFLTLGAPGATGNYVRFYESDLHPEIYDEGGPYRKLQFINEAGEPLIQPGTDDPTKVVAEKDVTTMSKSNCWRLLGKPASNDFVLMNADGKYMAWKNGELVLVGTEAEATRFAVMQNLNKESDYVTWCVCPLNADGTLPDAPQCLKRNADGSITLVDYAANLRNSDTGVYFGESITPHFSTDAHLYLHYLRIQSDTKDKNGNPVNFYLNGNVNGGFLAHGTEGKAMNYQATREGKVEFLNKQLWAFVTDKKADGSFDYVIMTRDSTYLAWGQQESESVSPAHFTTTLDRSKAAHFNVYFGSSVDADDYIVEYIPQADDVVGENRYLAFTRQTSGDKSLWLLTLQSERTPTVEVEEWSVADAEDYSKYRIQHKRSWFLKEAADQKAKTLPGFVNADYAQTMGWMENPYTHTQIQRTNLYTVHHYFKDGSSGYLHLPTYMKRGTRASASGSYVTMYERFYDYMTGGDIDPNRVILKRRSRRSYQNGTIMGRKLFVNNYFGAFVGEGFTFQMPPLTGTSYVYTVAVDASNYTDFVDYFGDKGRVQFNNTFLGANSVVVPSNQDLIEPTLSERYLYVIHNARDMAERMEECTVGSGKWLEEHTMAFPKKKVGFKNCTVPFNYQLRDYWFYNTADRPTGTEEERNEVLQNIASYTYLEFEVDQDQNDAGMALTYDAANQEAPDTEVWDKLPIDGAASTWSDLSEKQFLRFLYPAMGTDGKGVAGKYARPEEMGMALGESTVFKVYAVARDAQGKELRRFQLAKYTITFEDGTEPIPDMEIIGYKSVADTIFKSDRAPRALQRNYGAPRSSISFNPVPFVTYVTPPFGPMWHKAGLINPATTVENTYGFPLEYDRTGYNFQPLFREVGKENTWGSYTIAKFMQTNWVGSSQTAYVPVRTLYKKAYLPYATTEEEKAELDDTDAAFMYIDASELPGNICSLEYSEQLCKGSRLYVSAWISSPDYLTYRSGGDVGKRCDPANVILTVTGVLQDGTAKTLYKYCPGPIFDVARAADGSTIERGKGEQGIWQQVFFTFLNNDPDIDKFDHYELNIANACTSSDGGDILIDEVQVYSQKPEVMMERTTPVCGQEVTLAKLSCDYESLLGLLELKENEAAPGGNPYMWYCLLEKDTYDKALEGIASPTTADLKRAFNAALVGDPTATTGETRAFRKVQFSTDYDQLKPFDYREALLELGDEATIRRETTTDGVRRMIISDKVSNEKMLPRHDYYLVFRPRSADAEEVTADNASDVFQWGTPCCIFSEFRTTSSVTFYDDNDSTMVDRDNMVQICANQSVNIAATMNGIKINNGHNISFYTNNDWWLDYEGIPFERAFIRDQAHNYMLEYDNSTTNAVASAGSVSVKEALSNFRHFYPKAASIEGAVPQHDPQDGFTLTTQMIEGLRNCLKAQADYFDVVGNKVEKGNGAPLRLYNSTLNVTIASNAKDLQGMEKVITMVPIIPEENDTVVYCYEPVQLTIKITGVAPSMLVGFRNKEDVYPTFYTQTAIRTGQDFLNSVSCNSYVNTPARMLRLPMRKIDTPSGDAVGVMKIERDGVEFAPIYLVGTDDNQMQIYDPKTNSQFRIVGVVHDIVAPKEWNETAYADVYFLNDFKPREGYTYTLRMGFVEKFEDGHHKTDEEAAVCDGSLVFRLKIVPRYVKWTGGTASPVYDDTGTMVVDYSYTSDWTNDLNWGRADKDDLHLPSDRTYVTNEENRSAKAFVPLSFTNVIVEKPEMLPFQPQLSEYFANNREVANDNTLWEFIQPDKDTPALRTATDDIEYDLIADDTGLQETDGTFPTVRARPYYTFQAHDIVLRPGGEIVRSDLLASYHKAWMEYALKSGRWYTLSSPFQRMFAGDWYAPTKGGQQLTPYFEDVTFDKQSYDRFSPAVYQRGWDKGKATVFYLQNGTGQETLSTDVAIRADWSAVYNDAVQTYTQGGFSLKANAEGTKGQYTDLVFRLPKEDDSFDYYSFDGSHIGNNQTVDRTEGITTDLTDLTGRFLTDKLVNTQSELTQTYTNNEAGNAYFLVGNPFPCGINMRAFFNANQSVLGNGSKNEAWKYWVLTATGQTAAMKEPGNEGWVTINDETSSTSQKLVLAPGQGFFVKALESAVTHPAGGGSQIQLSFSPDMMTSATEQDEVELLSVHPSQGAAAVKAATRTPSTPMLRIRAERGDWHSETVVMKSASASNHYSQAEDMPLLLDASLRETPVVYTTADSLAVSINARRSMWRVPLGVSSQSLDSVRLTFTGMEQFNESLSLLDAETGVAMPLTLSTDARDGSVSVEVPGITAGRYFLLTSDQPTTPDDLTDDSPVVMVDGDVLQVTANSLHPLTAVRIVAADGRELYHFTPFQPVLRMKLPTGVYVVEAATSTRSTVAKVRAAAR